MSTLLKVREFLESALVGTPLDSRRKQWEKIRFYGMFLGYPRSGHTLVGALLNAHPNILIAHELNALGPVGEGITRNKLFFELVRRDRWFQEKQKASWQGYEYGLNGLHQGKSDNIRVIGDKAGGASVLEIRKNPNALEQLADIVQVPLRIIQHVRNPFDNITTMHLRHGKHKLDGHIRSYFMRTEIIHQQLKLLDSSAVCQIWHEEFCKETELNVRKLVNFLGEETDAEYESACRKAVYRDPKITRHDVDWSSEQIRRVEEKCKEYSFLERYTFNTL